MSKATPVLMYHSIAEHASPQFADFVVPPARFAEQMRALSGAGYRTMTMSGLSRLRQAGGAPAERTVVLTFDDGFLDFAQQALPVLAELGFTATLYVSTRFVGGRSRWLAPDGEPDRQMLRWSDLESVVAHGVEIGAHSDTHPQLDLLDERVLARELVVPKVMLEDRLGVPVASLAYPFGYADARVRDMTAQLGYDNACIVSDLVSAGTESRYAVPRLTVTGRQSGADLIAQAAAAPQWRDTVMAAARRQASRTLRRAGRKKAESAAYSRALR